jgi:hypothetical protein
MQPVPPAGRGLPRLIVTKTAEVPHFIRDDHGKVIGYRMVTIPVAGYQIGPGKRSIISRRSGPTGINYEQQRRNAAAMVTKRRSA